MRGWIAAAAAGLIGLVLLTAQPGAAASLKLNDVVLQVFTYPAQIDVPTAPSGLSIDGCELQWAPGSLVQGYRTYHGPSVDGFDLLTDIADPSVSSYDGLETALLEHSYYVTSYFDTWESQPSNTISVYCRPDPPLEAPTDFEGESHHSQRVVELSWEPVEGAALYAVLRSEESGGHYYLLGTTDLTDVGDTAVEDGVTYYYVVVALDLAGNESDPSAEIAVEDVAPPEPTATPVPTPTESPDNSMDPTPEPTVAPDDDEQDALPTPTPTPTATPTPENTPTPTAEVVVETEGSETAPMPTPTPTRIGH
jgi:hypothetical protein